MLTNTSKAIDMSRDTGSAEARHTVRMNALDHRVSQWVSFNKQRFEERTVDHRQQKLYGNCLEFFRHCQMHGKHYQHYAVNEMPELYRQARLLVKDLSEKHPYARNLDAVDRHLRERLGDDTETAVRRLFT